MEEAEQITSPIGLAEAFVHPISGVPVSNKKYHLKMYENVFTGEG